MPEIFAQEPFQKWSLTCLKGILFTCNPQGHLNRKTFAIILWRIFYCITFNTESALTFTTP